MLLMTNTAQQIPGTRQYIMKKRGVFKATVSRPILLFGIGLLVFCVGLRIGRMTASAKVLGSRPASRTQTLPFSRHRLALPSLTLYWSPSGP